MLWAYRTMSRRSIGETPFFMTFGTEALIPMEVGLLSMRITIFSPSANDVAMIEQLDFVEENREITSILLVNYQQKLSQGYNRNVRPREFIARDLVLQRVVGSMKEPSLGKLAPNWEGLCRHSILHP